MKNKRLHRVISILIAVFMLASVCTMANVSAYYGCEDDFSYTRSENEMEITGVITTAADVTIPEDINGYPVTEISDLAFLGCDTVVNLTIPYTVNDIGDRAFSACTNLESITVDENNPFFCSVDGVLFSKDMTELIQYPCAKQGDQYTVPQGVTEIEDTAFRASELVEITLPSSVEEIGYGAFEISEKLESIVIPEGVKSIDMEAFFYCTSLKEIKLPASLWSVHKTAFSYCTALERIDVAEENEIYTSDDGILFYKDANKLFRYPAGRAQTEYSVPEGITGIGDYAFTECVNLERLTLPESVKSIGESAFWDCSMLKCVTIPQNVIWILEDTFYNCSALEDVYYSGSESRWNEINFEAGNEYLIGANLHFDSIGMEPEGPVESYKLGDANCDGAINVKDATLIQRVAASLLLLDSFRFGVADCDLNGQVNVRDATAIQKYVAGIETGLRIGQVDLIRN